MNCAEARLLIGADPENSNAALEEHLRSCEACRQFRKEMRALDADIHRALEHTPESGAARPPAAAWRPWALAASVLLAVLGGTVIWLARPGDTLARELVAHVQAEPDSWLAAQQLSGASIDAALRGAGVELGISSDRIHYAQSCWFRGHYVPHLVVETTRGPVTLLILRHESVSSARKFHEDGMRGVLVPSGSGSIAIISRGDGDLENVAQALTQDVRWLTPASP